jgi:alkylation response protein AidB-like acyl-CoA dehydrogenase
MDFSFTEDQKAIRELALQIFTDRATDEFLLNFSRTDATYDDELWSTLAEQGLLGICVPEAFGGTGLGFIELCSILEEQGRRVAPVPVFASLVLGGLPIAQFGTDAQKTQWLSPLAEGTVKLSAAIAELGMTSAVAHTVSAKQEGEKWVLNGEKHAIQDGAVANCILVPATDDNGKTSIFLVDVKTAGVTITAQNNFSGATKASIQLNNVSLNADVMLGTVGQGEAIIAWLEQHADTALAAMQVGVCDEALKRTAAFTGERKQFGAPIGSFQAVAMRAADAFIDLEAMRSTAWQAMWRLSEGLPADIEVRAAKWWACDGSHRVVHAAQHLHGGMGSDVEFPIHRFFIMAKEISFTLGNGAVQLSKLGKLLASDNSVGVTALAV